MRDETKWASRSTVPTGTTRDARPTDRLEAYASRYGAALVTALGIPFFEGNRIDVLRNGVEIFPAMLTAIDDARESVDLLTYVYWTGDIAHRFADRLAAAGRRGVRVRVLLDGVGAIPMPRHLVDRMEDAGVQVRWFRPVRRWLNPGKMSHRTHRKVLVCDRSVGFTGGVGISEEWEGDARDPTEWRETHFRIEGPALQGLQAAFVGNWLEMDPGDASVLVEPSEFDRVGTVPIQVVRSSAAVAWTDMSTLMHTLIGVAERSIRISTPYFSPDESIAKSLAFAAESGVDVALLVPGPHIDQRVAQVAGEDMYEPLLESGVRISEYMPTMIHQKITVVDSRVVAIGSGNLNRRSLRQDDEVQLIVVDEAFAERVDGMLDQDWDRSEVVRPAQWKRRSWLQRAAEVVVRPFRGQL